MRGAAGLGGAGRERGGPSCQAGEVWGDSRPVYLAIVRGESRPQPVRDRVAVFTRVGRRFQSSAMDIRTAVKSG